MALAGALAGTHTSFFSISRTSVPISVRAAFGFLSKRSSKPCQEGIAIVQHRQLIKARELITRCSSKIIHPKALKTRRRAQERARRTFLVSNNISDQSEAT